MWVAAAIHSSSSECETATFYYVALNPLNPHDALKHHFTSLKTDLIFQQPRVLERTFPKNWFANT